MHQNLVLGKKRDTRSNGLVEGFKPHYQLVEPINCFCLLIRMTWWFFVCTWLPRHFTSIFNLIFLVGHFHSKSMSFALSVSISILSG